MKGNKTIDDLKEVLADKQRADIDKAMLDSMSTSFEMGADGMTIHFSFHPQDMSDLMRRCALRLTTSTE